MDTGQGSGLFVFVLARPKLQVQKSGTGEILVHFYNSMQPPHHQPSHLTTIKSHV